jgi:3-oxoacyl-[acyl-carrier protein] reductase
MISSPVVLISGASRGLGRTMALTFAKHGYAVGINYFQNGLEAKVTADHIRESGGTALLFKADVRSSADVNAMVKQLSLEWGRMDVLINNAGVVRNRTIAKMTDDDWREVLAVNLDGAFFCTRAVIPLMREQKDGGLILNISSYIAGRGVRGAANYAVAKAGLITLTKNTALEEGASNIRANAVMPGFHVTDMNKDVWERFEPDIRAQHLLKQMPEKTDMAEFVVFLSKLNTVTGQVFAFESRLL